MSKNKNKNPRPLQEPEAPVVDIAGTQAVVDPAPVVEAALVEVTRAPEVSVPPIDPAPVVAPAVIEENPFKGDPEYAAVLSNLAEAAIRQGAYGLAHRDIAADLKRRDPSADEKTIELAAAMVFERARDNGG